MVIHDFMAGNSNELTVRRGQTVEVLERLHDKPDWCLVRTTDRSPALEGLVPCAMLCIAHSRSSMEMEGIFNHKGGPIFEHFPKIVSSLFQIKKIICIFFACFSRHTLCVQ